MGRLIDEARVLESFLKDGRLVTVPARRGKRQVVLNHLAQRFQIGVRYSESEVNAILRPFYDDVASLRRYLVDEVFLDRENGVYWRAGGTVDMSDQLPWSPAVPRSHTATSTRDETSLR